MVAFGIEIESITPGILDFISKTNERLKGVNVVTNPFVNSKIVFVKNNLICNIEPVYINFPKYAFIFTLAGVIMFKGLTLSLWYMPPLVFLLLSLFWSKYLYLLVIKLGLKNAGYKGKVKLLRDSETIKRLIEWDSMKS